MTDATQNHALRLVDWGTVDYGETLERQRELFEELGAAATFRRSLGVSERSCVDSTRNCREDDVVQGDVAAENHAGWLILCEHPHVYTLGRSGKAENLLVGEDFLRAQGAALHRTERGGDITYHGPGQIVGYPILDLELAGLGLREYIEALEQAVIETVAEFGIEARRVDGKTGVWVIEGRRGCDVAEKRPKWEYGTDTFQLSTGRMEHRASGSATAPEAPEASEFRRELSERKICAIGVKASRGIVMHGLALNVATDLAWFENINPCGFVGGAVTSMERETGRKIAMSEVKRVLCERLRDNLKQ